MAGNDKEVMEPLRQRDQSFQAGNQQDQQRQQYEQQRQQQESERRRQRLADWLAELAEKLHGKQDIEANLVRDIAATVGRSVDGDLFFARLPDDISGIEINGEAVFDLPVKSSAIDGYNGQPISELGFSDGVLILLDIDSHLIVRKVSIRR